MSSPEEQADAGSDCHRRRSARRGPAGAFAEGGTDLWIPHGNMGPGHKHHQRKPDVGQQAKRRIGRVHEGQARTPDHDAGEQFAQHYRQPPAHRQCQQRASQCDDGDQRQGPERHGSPLRAGAGPVGSASVTMTSVLPAVESFIME